MLFLALSSIPYSIFQPLTVSHCLQLNSNTLNSKLYIQTLLINYKSILYRQILEPSFVIINRHSSPMCLITSTHLHILVFMQHSALSDNITSGLVSTKRSAIGLGPVSRTNRLKSPVTRFPPLELFLLLTHVLIRMAQLLEVLTTDPRVRGSCP